MSNTSASARAVAALQADSERLQLLTERSSLLRCFASPPCPSTGSSSDSNLPFRQDTGVCNGSFGPWAQLCSSPQLRSFSASVGALVPPCPELERGPWGGQTSTSALSSLLGCISVLPTVPAQKGSPCSSLAGKVS